MTTNRCFLRELVKQLKDIYSITYKCRIGKDLQKSRQKDIFVCIFVLDILFKNVIVKDMKERIPSIYSELEFTVLGNTQESTKACPNGF